MKVVENGRQLAKRLNADIEIVELAALLHDYAAIQDINQAAEHHIHGARQAEYILRELNYPPDKIKAVQHCILTHRGSKLGKRESMEAECVANADAMAHIENVPSLLYFAYVQKEFDTDEGKQWVRHKLQRTWRKMIPQAQTLVQEKYEAALTILA